MSVDLTKDQLIEKRVELENELNELQQEIAERTYAVDFETSANLSAVIKQVDKSYRWSIKNATLVVNLYDTLKTAKTAIKQSNDDSFAVELNSIELNTLYQVLTGIEGTGVESARTFVRLLTNVGSQISGAMESLAEANREVQQLHVPLAELDARIAELSNETVEADELSE